MDQISDLKSVELNLTVSLEEVKDSVNVLRQELSEMYPIIRDFKGLLQRKPLFERSTFVYLNPLAKEIKAEIMREVSSKLVGPYEEMKFLRDEIKATVEQLSDQTYETKLNLQDLKQDNTSLKKDSESLSANLDLIQRNLDDAREDLLLKAPYRELTKLVEKISTKATIEDFNTIKEMVTQCPTSNQVEKLYHQIEILNQQMISLASKDMVKEMEEGLMVNVENKFKKYVSDEDLKEESEKIRSLIRELNTNIDFFKAAYEKQRIVHKKELEKIQKLLLQRPWTKDVEIVSAFIDEKANQKDFEKLQNDVLPQVQFFDEKINLFNKKIEGFDRVLERYDEIILDKASKDDVNEIKHLLPKLMLSADFDHFKDIDTRQKEKLDEKMTLNHASVQEVEDHIVKFSTNYISFKQQFKEFMAKYASVKDLEYQLESKADKSDIYAMFDYTARREEVKMATQALEVFHKQLEMAVTFQLVAVKSMLKTNDSPALKNRQRSEVFNNLNTLIEWISHSIPPEIDKMMDSARSVLGMSQRKLTPQEPESSELMLPLLSNGRKYKKHTLSLTPAPDMKSYSEFL